MADIVSPEKRSRMMAGIGPKNTRPEMIIRKELHARGYRYRLHVTDLPGKPDLVFPKYHAVIFVHGCFWHGHGCRLFKWPSTRTRFWQDKIENNRHNDRKVIKRLSSEGWRVCIVWECALRGRGKKPEILGDRIAGWLHNEEPLLELKE
jgi:DNA mismatch endonuclease (patch repair protein)